MKSVVFWSLFLLGISGVSQSAIDSLENELINASTEEDKVGIMSQLVDLYGVDPEAELYVKSILDIGEKAGGVVKSQSLAHAYDFYLGKSDTLLGLKYLYQAMDWEKKKNLPNLYDTFEYYAKWHKKQNALDSAIHYYQLAEEGFALQKDYKNLAEVLNKQGIILKNIENYGEALEKYYEAYDIAKAHNIKSGLASTCINIGVVFKKQDQLEDAMDYYYQAEKIYLDLENYIGLANVYNNIGNIYRIQDEFDWALTYYKKAIKHRELGGSEKTLSYSYNNIALVHKEQLFYDSALHYLKLSEKYKIKLEENASLSSTYLNLAETYILLDDSINFVKYYELGKEYAVEYDQHSIIEELNIVFSKYAASKGNYQEAYEFLVSVIQQMDQLSSKEQEVLSQVLQAKYNDKQKQELIVELEDSLAKQNKQAEELQADEDKLWTLIMVLIGMFILLAVVVVLMFRGFRRVKQGAAQIEQVSRELTETRIGAEEKEMMIKEIHHRVKNNLQVVKSLIRLQKEGANEDSFQLLTEFENRVSSIALVHESLHGSVDLTKVDMEDYYEKLIQDLIEVYSVGQVIHSEVSVEELSFGLDTLIPLGLLTNEIVSNALKHGFRGKEKGTIHVTIKNMEDNGYLLTIADDGVGISEDYLSRNSLGLELIDTLVWQLEGTKELVVENGTKYIIRFKNQDKIK
jgi:two-component sensor histidine kinase